MATGGIWKNPNTRVTLYAQWTANTYTITLNGNGGSITSLTAGSNISVATANSKLTATFDKSGTFTAGLSRAGYTFKGWFKEDGSAVTGLVNGTISGREGVYTSTNTSVLNLANSGNIDIYAIWEEHTYTLIYNSNYTSYNGTSDTTYTYSTEVGYEEVVTALYHDDENLNFALAGYTFHSWNTAPTGDLREIAENEQVQYLTEEDGGTVTLYAIWTANTYTVVFDNNGGNGQMNNLEVKYDEAKALPNNSFERTNYKFAGWTTQNGGTESEAKVVSSIDEITESGIYLVGTTYYVYNLTTESKDVTLYAVWSAQEFTISYNANGGTFREGLTLSPEGLYLVNYTVENEVTFLTGADITYYGRTLVGFTITGTNHNWHTYISGDITLSETTKIGPGAYGNVTLTAQWQENPYTLTIEYVYGENGTDLDGTEAYETHTEQVVFGKTFNVQSPIITGYVADKLSVSGTMDSEDGITVTVTYTARTFTLTFDYMDESGSSTADKFDYNYVTVTYDLTYGNATAEDVGEVGLDEPNRQGYTFAGWWTTENYQDDTQIQETDTVKITSNITIYARWTPNQTAYKITYLFESLDSATVFEKNATYGDITDVTAETDSLITEDMVKEVTAERYPNIVGFTYSYAETDTVKADGSTVITVYMTRDYNTLTLTFDEGVDSFTASVENVAEGQEENFYLRSTGDNTYSVRFGAVVTLDYEISNAGYEFDEYSTLSAISIDADTFTMIDENVSIKATVNAKEFTITYHRNYDADDTETTTQTGFYNTTLNLFGDDTFTREGYDFLGWATTREQAEEGEYSYAGNSPYTMTEYAPGFDLYAVWSADALTFVVHYDRGINGDEIVLRVNGSVRDVDTISRLNYDDVIEIDLTNAVLTGYDFADVSSTGTAITIA